MLRRCTLVHLPHIPRRFASSGVILALNHHTGLELSPFIKFTQ